MPSLQSRLEVLPGFLRPVELQKRDARVLIRDRIGRVDLEDARKDGQRLGRPAAVGERDAEGVQRLRLLALAIREQRRQGLLGPAELGQQHRLLPVDALAARAARGRLLEGLEHALEVALAAQHHGEVHVAEPHLRVLGDDAPGDRDRLVALLFFLQSSMIRWSVWSTTMSVFGSSAGPYVGFNSAGPVR